MFAHKKCRRRVMLWMVVVPFLVGLPGCKHRRHIDEESPGRYAAVRAAFVAPAPMIGTLYSAGSLSAKYATDEKIAYSHSFTLEVPDRLIKSHFDRMQGFCLEMQGCMLLSAEESRREDGESDTGKSANLDVRVPHDRIVSFIAKAVAPLPGESAADVTPVRQVTTATDLGREVADVDRRLQQITAYRDRLEVLEGQSTGRVDDLIKIAKELSEAQSQLDDARKENNRLVNMIETEEVRLTYQSRAPEIGPLRSVWRRLGRTFLQSVADALQSLTETLVWLPIAALFLVFLSLALRRGWFRPKP